MPEIVGNLHLHTTASDGTGTHAEVATAAARAGLDFMIYTDHNVAVDGLDGWYRDPETGREILRLMGQEVNDQNEVPEHSHLLCYFVTDDLQPVAVDPQRLIDTVKERGGICFLAHPLERPGLKAANEIYPWLHWDVSGFTGIEIWNAMTDVKWQLRTLLRGVIGAYLPNLVLTAPFPEVLAKWDELLATGQTVVAIGNSDAHAMSFSLGLLRRMVYPYEYLFRAVNTHLILAEPLSRDAGLASRQVLETLKAGHCFVSYDLVGSSRGFVFTATSGDGQVMMGDTLNLQSSANLLVSSPQPAKLRLIKDGRLVAQTEGRHLQWHTTEPGVYRAEAYRHFWGWLRGWVFTNPIYIRHAL
jgi:hypothetical protein